MIKINYKALLKALSSLFIPTISICLFVFFLVLDLQKLIDIVFGPTWYSILIRLFILLTEVVLFYQIYIYYLKKENINMIKETLSDPQSYLKNIQHIHSLNITKTRPGYGGEMSLTIYEAKDFFKSIIDINKDNNISMYEVNSQKINDININSNANNVDVDIIQSNIKYYLIKTEEI